MDEATKEADEATKQQRKRGFWITLGVTVLMVGGFLWGSDPELVVVREVRGINTVEWPVTSSSHAKITVVACVELDGGLTMRELGGLTLGSVASGTWLTFNGIPKRVIDSPAHSHIKANYGGVMLQDGTIIPPEGF